MQWRYFGFPYQLPCFQQSLERRIFIGCSRKSVEIVLLVTPWRPQSGSPCRRVLVGAHWCILVHMPATKQQRRPPKNAVRRSVSIPTEVDTKIKILARQQNRSANQVIETLIEAGLEARESEKRRFFEIAEKFRSASAPDDIKAAKEELARMIFGN